MKKIPPFQYGEASLGQVIQPQWIPIISLIVWCSALVLLLKRRAAAIKGLQWRMLPADFAGWKIVYYYFSAWKTSGVIEMLHESLVEKLRVKHGKAEEPALALLRHNR